MQFGQAIANTAMNAKAKGDMLARAPTVNNELLRMVDTVGVKIGRGVPQHHFVAFVNQFAADFEVFNGSATHGCQRGLPAN